MKKKLIVLYSIALAFLMVSCAGEEADIFDDSAANRLTKAISEYNDLLCSSENGWIMEYFPTSESEGYIFLVKFDNGKAEVACKNRWINNGNYFHDTSIFQVIGDNGPVLSFNGYSEIIHFFCEPKDIPGTEANELGKGYEGDYEFILLDGNSDLIQLKGKKRGVKTRLTKLQSGKNWEQYFADIDAMEATLFNKQFVPLKFYISDRVYDIKFDLIKDEDDPRNGNTQLSYYPNTFSACPEGGDPITETEMIPFVITDLGIRLSIPFNEGDISVERFYLNSEKNALISDENESAIIVPFDLADYFIYAKDAGFTWVLSAKEDGMSPQFMALRDKLVNSLSAVSRRLIEISFKNSNDWGNSLFIRSQYGSRNTDGYFSFQFNRDSAAEIGYKFNGFQGTSGVDYDANAESYYNTFDGVADIVDFFNNSTTSLTSSGGAFVPVKMRLTSKSDANMWVDIEVKK